MPCLSENTVQRFVEGQLADEAAAAVEQHVDECPECRGVLADLGRALGADAVAAQDPGPAAGAPGVADEPAPRLARGASVGRYIVIDPIGAGGMSVVYAAYDAELDRKVALKLVHPGAAPAAGLPEVQARLAREAQALARLSHPNVITVYEVGTRGDEIFLAMELVEGPTLAGWLAERLRTWRATVRMFLQAGAGLAAAHAAGLVHRDFKPHNVLVGPDGRARILDFGLAQPAAAPRDRPERRAAPADGAEDYRAGAGAAALTRTGARLGTPAYMAPEQHRGEAVDARTDQFSFCVALFEALHGVRPFDAGDAGDLRRAVTEGQLRAPPRDRRVPARLRRIVRRGLNVRPEDRYPTMDALLADLTRATRARWWKAAAAVAAAALVAGTALAGRAHWQRQESACLRAETRLVGVWDPERQRRGRAAFVATGLDGAAAAWAQSAARLDAYTRAWAAARDEACAATRRGTQSEEVRDLRLECFDWRLEEVRAVAALLESADAMVVERAAGVTRTLTPVAECASTSALMRRPRSPRDPALRARSDAARSQVTRVRMLYYAGKLREARDVARGAAAAAHAAGQRPVEAEALLALGDILSALWETRPAEDAFWEAVAVAEASGHDEVRARALTALIWVLSNGNERTPARLDLAERCGRQASAVIERLGGDALMQARLEYTLGGLAEARGLVARARAHFERAVALRERAAPSPPDLTPALQALGGALAEEGRLAEATAVLERALAMVEQDVGPNHPRFAYCLLELARVRAAQGRGDEAVTLSKRAQALAGRVLGRESGLGIETLMVAGDSLAAAGHPAEARARYGEALASAEKTFGPADPRVARALDRVGNMLRLAGQPAAALTHQRRALAILARAVEPGHPDLARVLHDTGETLRAQGSHAEAVATLERALAGREQREVRPADVAATRFALAQALAAAGRDAARARDLAARARAGYARAEGQHAAALAVIDAWLARPGR